MKLNQHRGYLKNMQGIRTAVHNFSSTMPPSAASLPGSTWVDHLYHSSYKNA